MGNDTGLKEQICRSRASESFVVSLYRYGHPSFDEALNSLVQNRFQVIRGRGTLLLQVLG